MILPTVTEIPQSRDMIDVFGGYNHNLKIGDGEFYNEKNMSSDNYPILSNRRRRGVFELAQAGGSVHHINGMISKNSLCWVDGGTLYINGHAVENFDLDPDTPKQLVSMGGYIVIFPDKKYINTVDLSDCGSLESTTQIPAAGSETSETVEFKYCTLDGTELSISAAGQTAPADPIDKQYWLNTSGDKPELVQWSVTSSMWMPIATTYIKIVYTGIGTGFEVGDGITVSGIPANASSHGLEALNNTSVIQAKGDDFIVLIGVMDTNETVSLPFAVSDPFKAERLIPEIDYVCECGNRLWGCRYGPNNAGDIVNEIYASKLGDMKNFNVFDGVSTDSYYASCGTDGAWTGCINFLGKPLFFKENCYHLVYGSYPSQFKIVDAACRGVQKESSRSLAIVNETLFYKSSSGVMAFTGGLPTEVSYQLGNVRYTNAVAGAHEGKYYISMKDMTGVYHLFVFDTEKGIWHREDNTEVSFFCSSRPSVEAINETEMFMAVPKVEGSTHKDVIYRLIHGDNSDERMEWLAETGVIGLTSVNKKYVTRIDVRLSQEFGSTVRISAQYDSNTEWMYICTLVGNKLGSFSVPIRPYRCDHMRLRLEGNGDVKIYSISKVYSEGSDI